MMTDRRSVLNSSEDFKRALRRIENAVGSMNGGTLKAHLKERMGFYKRDSEESGVIFCDRSSHICRLIYQKAVKLFPDDEREFYSLLPEHEKDMLRLLYPEDTDADRQTLQGDKEETF